MASIRTGGAARAPGKQPRMHSSSSSALLTPATMPLAKKAPNVDRVKNLVDMAPLIESLMVAAHFSAFRFLVDRRPNPSFRRRASMVYTPTPQLRKVILFLIFASFFFLCFSNQYSGRFSSSAHIPVV
ncbi:hypothetical protein ZIOFF_027639 [Zingiber officinale]|uniref:Uncharacterized protein n=1 Tax=Zingiber officinale TaxID=94328 RepID=A0A8J5L8G9_ZINOF|nr:hypothetical protein ZIOFF_027639 [Zingiber officinale]